MTEEQRTARRAAKEAKRQANKENWKFHPANANAAWMQQQTELKNAAAVLPELLDPADDALGSGSLARMRTIMLDQTVPLYRRLDAAEIVLSYELGPAGAVGVLPEQIAAISYRFLKAVSDAPETPDALWFRADKALVAVENRRAAASQSSARHQARRELFVDLVNMARRRALHAAGVWEQIVGTRYWLSLDDDFDIPEVADRREPDPSASLGSRLDKLNRRSAEEKRRDDAAWQEAMLAVRARNRPDNWDRLLAP